MKLFAKWTTMLLFASGFIFALANGLTTPPASAKLGGNFYSPTAQTIDISPLPKTIGERLEHERREMVRKTRKVFWRGNFRAFRGVFVVFVFQTSAGRHDMTYRILKQVIKLW